MKTLKSGLATAAAAIMTAAALAGCAGGPEDPDSSLAPRDDSTASATATSETETSASPDDEFPHALPELMSIVEDYEGRYVLASAAGTGTAGTVTRHIDQQVPLETDELEAHIYCLPIGSSGVLRVNSERHTIECPGTEAPEVLVVSTDGVTYSSDISWQLRLEEDSDWQQAVVLLPAN